MWKQMTLAVVNNMYQLSTYKHMTNVQRLGVIELYILVLCDWTDGTNIWTTPGGNIFVYQQMLVMIYLTLSQTT